MNRRVLCCALLSSFVAVALAGCSMTIEDMKAMRPERPVELDALNAFVGAWDFSGQAEMAGLDEPLETTGANEVKWAGDGWYLVSEGTFNMGELGEMKGLEVWTYDAKARKYRTSWADNMGGTGRGVAKFNKKNNTWTVKARVHTPWGRSVGKGTVEIVDDNTMEWVWAEYVMFGLFKTMEMSGTSTRR